MGITIVFWTQREIDRFVTSYFLDGGRGQSSQLCATPFSSRQLCNDRTRWYRWWLWQYSFVAQDNRIMPYFLVADRFHGCYLVQNLSMSEHQKSTWTYTRYPNRYSRQQKLQEPFPIIQQHEGGGIRHNEEADAWAGKLRRVLVSVL